jgi:hypothetical protein
MSSTDRTILLGDGKTSCDIKKVINCPVSVLDGQGKIVTANLSFNVFDTTIPVIIGLPDIIRHFYDVFIDMMKNARHSYLAKVERPVRSSSNITANVMEPAILKVEADEIQYIESPWEKELEEAPEDLLFPVPSSFANVMCYFEGEYDDLLQSYKESLMKNVCPEFRQSTNIMEILMSPDALKVFVPREWKCINMEPIELRVKPSMPESMRPSTRFINP